MADLPAQLVGSSLEVAGIQQHRDALEERRPPQHQLIESPRRSIQRIEPAIEVRRRSASVVSFDKRDAVPR
jgi:hypothetical protein